MRGVQDRVTGKEWVNAEGWAKVDGWFKGGDGVCVKGERQREVRGNRVCETVRGERK